MVALPAIDHAGSATATNLCRDGVLVFAACLTTC